MLHPDIERVALIGWRLYPCSTTTRRGCIKQGATQATYDLDQLARWSHEFRGCSWRVVMEGSGIWALDIDKAGSDHKADGIAAMADLVKANGPLPARPTTRSGGGGLALFFRHNGEQIHGATGYPAPGIDPRRGRLSITIPPSIHHSTRRAYRWIAPPWEISPPAAPQWLLDAVRPPPEPARPAIPYVATSDRARRRLSRAIDTVSSAGPGAANNTLNKEAYAVARHCAAGVLSENEAVEALYAAARQRAIPHREARDTIQSAFRSGFQHPLEASWSAI